MEAELREVMRFLNRVGDDRDPRDEWFRSPAGTLAVRLSLVQVAGLPYLQS